MHLNAKSFNGKNLSIGHIDRIFVVMKNVYLGGCLSLPGAINMYMTIIFKHLPQNGLANQKQISCGAFFVLWEGCCNILYKWTKAHEHDDRHVYKVKSFKIFYFFRTSSLSIMKLGMEHRGLNVYKVYH